MWRDNDKIPLAVPTDADFERIRNVWNAMYQMSGGREGSPDLNVQNFMDAWLVERRMEAENNATDKLIRVTWLLVYAMVALFAATLVLAYVGWAVAHG